jgi:hypothetical protein
MAFASDADRVRIPVNRGTDGTVPQTRSCKCTLARGVWIDRWSHVRCDLCNLKIREWENGK